MAYITLPRDTIGNGVQALAPDGAGTVQVASGAASARVALPADCDVVRVAATQDCFIRFGNSAVTAAGTDAFFPKGSEVFRIPTGATHIAAIQSTTGGTVSITRML